MRHPVPEVLGSGSLEEFVGYLIGVRFQQRNSSFFKGVHGVVVYVLLFFGGAGSCGWMNAWKMAEMKRFFCENSSPFVRRWKMRHPIRYSANRGLDEFVFFLFAFETWNIPGAKVKLPKFH